MREVSFAGSVMHSARTVGARDQCERKQVLAYDRKPEHLYGNRNTGYSRPA